MIKCITIGSWRFTFTASRVTKVIGVNSTLTDGKHILMWDFDNTTPDRVKGSLQYVQDYYGLPDIIVVCTKEPTNYVAYCFSKFSWQEALKIVCDTCGVDHNFIRFSAYREHFTLRVTPKGLECPHFKCVIKSDIEPDCSPADLVSWVKYETLKE